MMRLFSATLIATLTLANTALAQQPPAYVIPSAPAPSDPLPRFTIAPRGGVLAPVGLPLPQIGLRPPPGPGEPTRHHRGRRSFTWPTMVFYVPQPAPAVAPAPAREVVDRVPATGRLILEVEPGSAQIFADGYYMGTSDDFSIEGGGGVLEAGIHRIDVSADGYEPATVHLRVIAGQPLTYRAALNAMPPPASIAPTTFYLIPGCYMGNVPPEEARLPASCDQSRAVIWRP